MGRWIISATGLLALLLSLTLRAAEPNGKVMYEQLCGACHGPDGKGAGEGTFPPLAGSEWVKGDAERMVQVVLHGLEGTIRVKKKSYNLVMPPQGAALTDPQIAAIVSYVRGAWGNKESPVDVTFVSEARERSKDRKQAWTAKALQRKWPLPMEQGPLTHLVSSVYEGDFKAMPDFEGLKPVAVEEEAGGFINLATLRKKQQFAVVWEGEFEVPRNGKFVFRLDSDDGSQLFVNGQKVVSVMGLGGLGRTREGKVMLEAGTAKLRVEYFNYTGAQGIALSMRGGKRWTHFTRRKANSAKKIPSIPIVVKDEARIYRNFIKGTSARAIAVGYPGGVNLSFSADDLGWEVAWIGDFIDAGLHWTGRGKGAQGPAGQRILNLGMGPSFAIAPQGPKSWPKSWQPELKARFDGYVLDKQRFPEFQYQVAGVQVLDKPAPVGDRDLVRNLTLRVDGQPPEGLMMRLYNKGAKQLSSHAFQLESGVRLEIAKGDGFEAVTTKEGVFLKLKLKKGVNRIGLRYVWK